MRELLALVRLKVVQWFERRRANRWQRIDPLRHSRLTLLKKLEGR